MEPPKLFFTHILLLFYIIHSHGVLSSNKQKSTVIDDVVEIKDFKQLLRTKTNVMVCFISSPSPDNANVIKSFKEAAAVIKGHGTMLLVDCNGSTKKMCRKLKVDLSKPITMKHYKDGEFHKDYDRRETTPSIVNFMRDPTGSLPWDEDPTATDIIHLANADSINRFLKKGPTLMKPSMIMFYAPWCGYCKVMKPEYSNAAADLKGEAYLAAIDVARPENSGIRRQYNITGFPTLLFFENGQMKYRYEGDTKRPAIVEFMRFPRLQHKSELKDTPEEKSWSDTESDIAHLTTETFATTLSDKESALVMFYAPWCGHCKRIKPEYERAAATLKDQNNSILAAVDATKEPNLASRFGVKGYPTLKYFVNGEYKYDVTARDESKIIDFMKNPQAPPPPEPQWTDEVTNVVHLQQNNFRSVLKKKKHALVMFYAPWCGHCKKAKPEFVSMAEALKDDSRTIIGAVDCTKENALCQEQEVSGYPTIKYLSFYDKVTLIYSGGRTEKEMIAYLKNPSATPSAPPPAQKDGFEMNPNILQLTDANFDKEIKVSKPILVMFYAPWCGHCKMMKPAFEAAAGKLKNSNIPAMLGSVDCTVQKTVANIYKIESYPTIILFDGGVVIEKYNKGRNEEEMVAYMKNAATLKAKNEL
ncbi:protein disulfide-isomerase A5 isoform X2 [Arctopsyche grandis]|uniref:protein disulfide-isomerase A5 isoform X2 n=1 Tax=Arctopsyche grandis TaxID=121162 RepID=UPI00406D9D02